MSYASCHRDSVGDRPFGKPKTLFGYDVIDVLGAGAGSELYAVSDPATGQLYALKHVTVREPKDERFMKQLEAEYEIGRCLTHPGLRRCVDLKIVRSLLRKPIEAALVMELFDGAPIEFVMPGAYPEITRLFIDVAEALDALHKAGFVHCDIKPGNILRAGDGQIKVIDFGQACRIGTAKERIQGTPDFIAPEQVRCSTCTVRTDVYSFGATLYWALCRKKVPTLYTVQQQTKGGLLLDDRIPSPHEVKPSVPERLSNLVMECVRTNPQRRPANMADVARRLEVLHFAMTHTPVATSAMPDLDDTCMSIAVA
jgi:serine/threonine-protein kinase